MTIDEFRNVDANWRIKKPKLFSISTPDAPASDYQLSEVESALGFKLGYKYRAFLKEFGGGRFGLTTIFSAVLGSEWYLPNRQADCASYLPTGYLAFSDDFAGGLYVFCVEAERAGEQVFYWNTDGGVEDSEYDDIYEFVAVEAYDS